jgi:hypothetical protein
LCVATLILVQRRIFSESAGFIDGLADYRMRQPCKPGRDRAAAFAAQDNA